MLSEEMSRLLTTLKKLSCFRSSLHQIKSGLLAISLSLSLEIFWFKLSLTSFASSTCSSLSLTLSHSPPFSYFSLCFVMPLQYKCSYLNLSFHKNGSVKVVKVKKLNSETNVQLWDHLFWMCFFISLLTYGSMISVLEF